MLDESNMPYSARVRCSNCDGFECPLGAVNPARTAMANALRVGDHLLERLGARAA